MPKLSWAARHHHSSFSSSNNSHLPSPVANTADDDAYYHKYCNSYANSDGSRCRKNSCGLVTVVVVVAVGVHEIGTLPVVVAAACIATLGVGVAAGVPVDHIEQNNNNGQKPSINMVNGKPQKNRIPSKLKWQIVQEVQQNQARYLGSARKQVVLCGSCRDLAGYRRLK